MINFKNFAIGLSLFLLVFAIEGCGVKKKESDQNKVTSGAVSTETIGRRSSTQPNQLPVRYQTPGYLAAKDNKDDTLSEVAGDFQLKVGATIRSTNGPQPLWDIMKRLANLKGMTVSWASDVDQTVPVDVDIAANDNFFDAIANLLRQADYFHEVNGKNIIVRNKTTKVFQIGLPVMQGTYATTVGGNFLSSKSTKDAASGAEGTVKITSADNKFNIWDSIEANLKVLLKTDEAERIDIAKLASQDSLGNQKDEEKNTSLKTTRKSNEENSQSGKSDNSSQTQQHAKYSTKDSASFVIDKNIGLVTVTAKPGLIKIVENYINNIKKHVFQQVNIEAKIIEVYLQNNSKIGIDWSSVLKDKQFFKGEIAFGNAGQIHPRLGTDPSTYSNTFVSRVDLSPFTFTTLLNALNEQGDTHVLANPRITVLNGQPAIISVGKDVAYVKSVTREEDADTNKVTFTAETGNVVQGIALGVMASVLDSKKVNLHLTPITTTIENLDAEGNVPMTSIGDSAIKLGLPQVKVREMSTMVEVEDGEMLVIGGLIDSIEAKTGQFAPGLGSIPGLRYLFGVEEKTMQKRELVILLTPKII